MDEEHEMCPNCHKDVSVSNYRAHTLHCRRHVVRCPDCHLPVAKTELEAHCNEMHVLKTCNMCHVHVEAYKLQEHQESLCPQKPVACSFCHMSVAMSALSEHERECGDVERACPDCGICVVARKLKEHQRCVHNKKNGRTKVSKSGTNVSIKRYASESNLMLATSTEPATENRDSLLPCEFCEGLIPSHKLLEHQAACVNPSNVRRSTSVSRASSFNVASNSDIRQQLCRSNSLNWRQASLSRRRPSYLADSMANKENRELESSARIRCDLCGENMPIEARKWHKLLCEPRRTSNATTFLSYRRGYCTLNRTGSYRETRATTEERPFGNANMLRRQSSFTENNPDTHVTSRRTLMDTATSARGLCRSSSYSSELTSVGVGSVENTRGVGSSRLVENRKTKCVEEKKGNETEKRSMESTKMTKRTNEELKSKTLNKRRVSFTDDALWKEKEMMAMSMSKEALLVQQVNDRLADFETTDRCEVEEKKVEESSIDSPPIIMQRLDKSQLSNKESKDELQMNSTDISPMHTSASCSSEASPAIQRSKPLVVAPNHDEDDFSFEEDINTDTTSQEDKPISTKEGAGTVQNLAQDLAAECAKAYALMENSLSKLSTDLPFGLTLKRHLKPGKGARS